MDRVIQEIRHMFISSIILVTSRVFYYIFENSTWGIFATANNDTSFDPMVIITNTIAILSVIIFVFSLIRFITGLLGYEPNIKLTTSIHIEIPIIKQKKFGRVSVKKVIIKLPGTFTYDQVKEVQKIIERPINAIFIKIHNSDDQDVEKKLYGTYAEFEPYIRTICDDFNAFIDTYNKAATVEERDILWNRFISCSQVIQDAIRTIDQNMNTVIKDELAYKADYEQALKNLSKDEAVQKTAGYQPFQNLQVLNTIYDDGMDKLFIKYGQMTKKSKKKHTF
jgi:hypothetical protein